MGFGIPYQSAAFNHWKSSDHMEISVTLIGAFIAQS